MRWRLDLVRPTDDQKPDADRLRADIQRQPSRSRPPRFRSPLAAGAGSPYEVFQVRLRRAGV